MTQSLRLFVTATLCTMLACSNQGSSERAASMAYLDSIAQADSTARADSMRLAQEAKAADTKKVETSKKGNKQPVAKKPAAAKDAPKKEAAKKPTTQASTTKPITKPATKKASDTKKPQSGEPFSLVAQAQQGKVQLSTFENEMEDMTVPTAGLQVWKGKPADYIGKYAAPLGSEIAEIETHVAGSKLTLVASYSSEVASTDGMIDQQQGDANIAPKLVGSTLSWTKVNHVYITQAQYVTWTSDKGQAEHGLLAYGKAAGKPAYVLLRKVKA